MRDLLDTLRPFAEMAPSLQGCHPDQILTNTNLHPKLTVGDYRAAAALVDRIEILRGDLLVQAAGLKAAAIETTELAERIERIAGGRPDPEAGR